jgi:hypothetical protein
VLGGLCDAGHATCPVIVGFLPILLGYKSTCLILAILVALALVAFLIESARIDARALTVGGDENRRGVAMTRERPLRMGAWRFGVTFGVISLLSDFVYEGARSITGPLADRTKRFWA